MTSIDRRRDVGVPEGSRAIAVDGVRLAVAVEGQGPSVICLHAIGHGGRDFEAFAAVMRDRFTVVRVDWPGHGRSGVDREPPTPGRYADLVRGIATALGLADPIIVGCSIGGAAAICYAARYGAKALVLANSGGLIEVTPGIARACRFMANFFAAGARGAWWFGAAYAIYYRLVLPSPAAAAQRKRIVAAGYENAAALTAAWRQFADPAAADQRQAAISLAIPVLVAWAMGDRINRFGAVQPVIARMRRARVAAFRGGHAAFLEQPEQFAAVFADFIAAIDRAPVATETATAESATTQEVAS